MKSARVLTVLATAALLVQCSTPRSDAPSTDNSPRTLLAIFAHPDDEATVAPVLAKYAAEGVIVLLQLSVTVGVVGGTASAGHATVNAPLIGTVNVGALMV